MGAQYPLRNIYCMGIQKSGDTGYPMTPGPGFVGSGGPSSMWPRQCGCVVRCVP